MLQRCHPIRNVVLANGSRRPICRVVPAAVGALPRVTYRHIVILQAHLSRTDGRRRHEPGRRWANSDALSSLVGFTPPSRPDQGAFDMRTSVTPDEPRCRVDWREYTSATNVTAFGVDATVSEK